MIARNAPLLTGPCGSRVDFNAHEHTGPGHRERGVHDAGHLGIRAFEVGDDLIAVDGELQAHQHRVETSRVIELEIVLVHVLAIGQLADAIAHPPLGAVEVHRDAGEHGVPAVLRNEAFDALLRHPTRPERCVEIAEPLLGQPHVAQQQAHHPFIAPSPFVELDRGDADPFLVDAGRKAGIAARGHPAHVRPVGAHRGEDEQLSAREDREEHRDVVQVGAATVGVVEHDDVAFVDVSFEVLHRATHRPRHRHHMPRMVVGLRHHLRQWVEQRAREVVQLVDHRGERGADDRRPHLLDDGAQTLAHDLEGNRIDVFVVHGGIVTRRDMLTHAGSRYEMTRSPGTDRSRKSRSCVSKGIRR